jgi:acetyl-CoA acyltransferase
MKPVVIVDFVRSPFTCRGTGSLAGVRADEIAAQVVAGLVKRSGLEPLLIEDLILGCAFPEAEQGFNLARLVGFIAGLPKSMGAVTVNRFCGSSMQAIHMAAGSIQMNGGEAFICAGVESMTRVPMTGFNPLPNPKLYKNFPQAYMSMGETAENLARLYKIARADQEAFAIASQLKAARAREKGLFKDEIIPIQTENGVVTEDGCLRPEVTLQKLSELKPAFEAAGTVTAGTSSPITDGSSAVLVTSLEFAEKHHLTPLALIRAIAVSGCEPDIMGIGPVESTRKALKRAEITLADVDVIELNEAFAAQALAVIQELHLDMDKINLDGGALAIGHPLGATGARITGKLAQLLKRQNGRYGLATQCIGGGQGIATVLERL